MSVVLSESTNSAQVERRSAIVLNMVVIAVTIPVTMKAQLAVLLIGLCALIGAMELSSCSSSTCPVSDRDTLHVAFETGFNSDSADIFLDDVFVGGGRFQTLPQLGLAGSRYFSLSNGYHRLRVRMPEKNKEYAVGFMQCARRYYAFVWLDYQTDSLFIQMSDIPHYYD